MKRNEGISPGQIIKAYVYGDTIELSTSNLKQKQSILVLPNHRYVVLSTGEIKKMKLSGNNRVSNLSSVKRTMKNLRRLITANFTGGGDQLWITLTYANNVSAHHASDTQIVYRDFKVMMQRIRKQIGNVEYIAVLEPQCSGRWHLHVLMKSRDGSDLYIPNTQMAKLWSKGFTKTKRLSDQDNIAAYVMSYVSNLKIDDGSSKRNVKGARLYLYPKGARIYRRSKGIKDPLTLISTKINLAKRFKLDESERRASYEQTFMTRSGKKIITQTEFYNRKEKPHGVKSNSDKKRT